MKKLFLILLAAGAVSPAFAQTVTGSGTTNCIPRFTGASTIGNSAIYSNGTNATIGSSTDFTFRWNIITSASNDGIRVLQTGASSAALRLDNSYTGGHNWGMLSTSNGNSQGGGKLLFYDYSASSNRERMVLDGNGNLGIGITSLYGYNPQTKLHVHDGSLKLTGTDPVHGAPNIFWGGTPSSAPSGQWALEYSAGMGGMNFWRPFGSNAGLVNNVMFLGDNNRVGIRTANTTKADFTVNGNVLIGDPTVVTTATPYAYGLYVQNGILTSRVRVAVVNSASWADYVFAPDYQLRPLSEVNTFVQANHHLPGIPSAEQVQQDGVDLLEMNILLLQKVEELTLYLIQQEQRIATLEGEKADNAAPGN